MRPVRIVAGCAALLLAACSDRGIEDWMIGVFSTRSPAPSDQFGTFQRYRIEEGGDLSYELVTVSTVTDTLPRTWEQQGKNTIVIFPGPNEDESTQSTIPGSSLVRAAVGRTSSGDSRTASGWAILARSLAASSVHANAPSPATASATAACSTGASPLRHASERVSTAHGPSRRAIDAPITARGRAHRRPPS